MVAISSNNTDVTVSSSPLTFTTSDWSTEQTVTVTARQDADAANDMATLTHNPSGANYGSVSNAILMVTVTDDDTAGVTVTPTSLMVNEGGTNTYTVVLDTEPTATVTVTIVDPTDNADVMANPASLTFSTLNWNTAQTVTVSAAEDDDSTQDTATVTHTVAGGDYASFAASSVFVTVTDNDTPGVTVTPPSLTVGEGSTGTYTVVLNTQPSGDVTVAISSNNTDVTVPSSPLTFTTTTWNSAQTVTVTAGQDDDAANDMATLTHVASGADYGSVDNAILTVTVTDMVQGTVSFEIGEYDVTEGDAVEVTMVLSHALPGNAAITFPLSTTDIGSMSGDYTVPETITFGANQTSASFTFTAIQDTVEEGHELVLVFFTLPIPGENLTYGEPATTLVTIVDDYTPGMTVTPTSLTLGEGGTATYTVKLDTAPTDDVTVAITSNNTDVTVSSSPLTFTTSDWSTEQTVTVTARQDADAANDMATLTHNPSGANYGSVSNAILMVTVTDDDTAGVTVTPTSLMVNEGGTNTYTVVLDTEPTATVTVTIVDPTDNADVMANPASLTFSTLNWNTAQTVTVSAAEDADSARDRATVTHTVAGGDYDGVTADSVAVTVTDNDTPGVTVTPPSLTVGEGSTGTYDVVLNTQPTGAVMVAISSNNPDVTVSSSPLTFTTSDWNAEQTVTVTARQDADAANDMATLTHNPSGADYGSVSNAILMVTVTDDDTAGLVLSVTFLEVDEGNQNTYTVKLQTQPTTTVTVTVSSDDTGVATVSRPTLRFTTSNWDTAQTVTVRGVNDGDSGDETVTITNTASGGDYAGVTETLTVTVDDDDTAGITFTPAARTIREGATGTYDVKLNTSPTSDVTVAISSDNADVTVNTSSLTFTVANYARNQRVTVTAGQDADAADDTANLTHRPSGGGYGSGQNKTFMVTVTDNDTAGLTVTPTSLAVNEGGTNTYTVVLDTQPTATVTVTIVDPTDNTDVTADPASLTFTDSDWSTEQTVTVSAAEDNDASNDTARLTHSATSTDTDYQGITISSVTVTVTDNESPSPPSGSSSGSSSGGGGGGGGGAPQNRSPEFTDGSRTDRSIAENTPAGANIGEPVAASDRENDTLTYSLRGSDADLFNVDASSGQLLTKAALDYETEASYSVIVAVSDGKSSSGRTSNSNDDFITVTITVTNEDEAGTVALSSADPDVGVSLIATLTDPDGGLDRVVWSWERSADQTAWTAIRGAASAAYTPVAADKGSHLRATASYTDGHGPRKSAQAATSAPVPSNAAPVFTGVQAGVLELSVAENTNAGEAVGAPVAAMDAEDDALTYALSGADADLFVIDAGTGEIRVGAGTTLDYEADKNVYEVTVTVTDSLGLSATVAVTITVTNVGVGSPLGDAYDADGNEAIDRDDAVTAVADYFADRITREEVIAVIQLYFAG